MFNYYCKNCNNIVVKFYQSKFCNFLPYYNYVKSKNNKKINFLNCKKCNKFIGIICFNVCMDCFGEDLIFGEKKLYNWFQTYRKIISDSCKNCNNKVNFRFQHWFFKELTFYK